MRAAQAIRRLLAEEFPDLNFVETSTLHRGVAGARHSFLPAPPAQNKLDVLAQVSWGSAIPVQRTPAVQRFAHVCFRKSSMLSSSKQKSRNQTFLKTCASLTCT